MVKLTHFVLLSLTAACDFTLYARTESTNILAIVKDLDPIQSPYVLCLAGSTATKHFTMDDIDAGCLWTTRHLIIQ